MARRSPSSQSYEDVEEDDSDDLLAGSFFPPLSNRLLTSQLLNNILQAQDLRAALEALAKYTNDPTVEWVDQELLPPGWEDAKEFIGVVLPGAWEKFYRMDAFLRVHQDYPEQLFACMYLLSYACAGFTAIVADWSHTFGELHDQELAGLLQVTYSMLDSRAAVWTLPCVRQMPNLDVLLERTESVLMAQLPGQLSGGESDDDVAEAKEGVIHVRSAHGGNQWQAYLVQLLLGTGFVENVVKIISAPQFHTMHLHNALLNTLLLVIQLNSNVVRQHISSERRHAVARGLADFLTWVSDDVLADPEKFFSGRQQRASQCLSPALSNCNELIEALQLPNTQLTVVQRKVVTEMLKSSNFTRLLSAVQECRSLLDNSLRRSSQMVEGNADPDVVGIEDNVRWLDEERIVKQMLRVNLHQSQYVDAVLGILRLLAECGHFNDEHLDMLWGVTEQEDTFDAVKTNVCHMIKQLAQHLRPQQLDLLFSKFENRKGRTLSDTLRLLDLLRRLAQSDTKKANSMAAKLVELVWELTTPADAPPELLNSSVMLDVLEGYKQHALLYEYIQRCIAQLRARTNVYTALTVLQNLLRLWGKLYGWEARNQTREERRSGAPRPLCDLLAGLDREDRASGAPPLSRLLVDNLCDFMAAAARWLEERRAPPQQQQQAAAAAAGAPGGGGGAASVASGSVSLITQQPPGQGSYSYQQVVRRYLEVFRLVSQCKDTYTELRLVEALWDAVVLRPNTPEDMPSGLDLILACAGEANDDAAAAAAAHGMVTPPGPLLEARDLAKLLQDRVTRLPVENLAQPAFQCFRACFQTAHAGLLEHLQNLAAHPNRSSRGELDEAQTTQLRDGVRMLGMDYLWQIVLDCQRPEVTSAASDMLINELYDEGVHDMIIDTRTRLMDAAAQLMSAPPGTQEWEHVELPADVMESSRWEQARTRATRCMHLLERLAGKGEEAMPPVPMHSASWQGPSQMMEVNTQEQGRLKIVCFTNEYVGLLRRKVAQRLGVEPACVRLMAGGQELRNDGRTLQSALPATWSPRQTLLAQISPRPNRYTRFGEEWWDAWHRSCNLALMYHDDQLYRVLLLLADLPKAPRVRAAASRLLQQLPTCGWVPAALLEALHSDQPAAQLRRQLLGPSGGVDRPGLLLYTLQALYALLQPSYPADLLPLVSKPWTQEQQQQQPPAATPARSPTAAERPPQLGAAAAGGASQSWWQVVAAGGGAERLLPVLAKCVPLLAEVVDKVMAPVAGAAEAVTAAAGAGAVSGAPPLLDAGRQGPLQPAADLAFVKDFQWVMVFLVCNIYQRSRRGTSAQDGRGQPPGAGAAAGARPQSADSLSSSHGHDYREAAPSAAAGLQQQQQQQPHLRPSQQQRDSLAGPSGPAASGGQESDVLTQEATAAPLPAAATPPEVTSADAEACMSVQLPAVTQEGADSAQLQATCGSGPAAAAALVSGLVVSSRGSPDGGGGGGGREAGREPTVSSFMDTSVADGATAAGVSALPPPQASQSAQVPMCGSSTDVEMVPAGESSRLLPPAALSQKLPHGGPSPGGPAMSVSMALTAAGAPFAAPPPMAGVGGGTGGFVGASDGRENLFHYMGSHGVRCLVSLLVRMAHEAGCLWGYGQLLTSQQPVAAAAADGRQLGGATAAAAAGAPSYQLLCSAADVACRVASKALQVLSKLVHWPDMRDVFMRDPRTVPMLLETLSCVFSAAIRDAALHQLEGVFGGGAGGAGGGGAGSQSQLQPSPSQLPPASYMWALTSLVSLRPAMEVRLDSCLEFHVLLCKVLHQLPELQLAAPSAEARLLADRLLSEEVARLDAGAEELLEPARRLLLRGKLMLVRGLVRALERLGLGLGANGRPGLISILLNRYLFPEATLLWQPDASYTAMEAALQHVAADGGVRREALQLVQFLMTACPSNLEQGLKDLSRLHYDNGLRIIDRKFDGEGVRSEDCYMGLRNGGATCYMNSVLQQLFMQPRIRELVLQAGAVDPEDQPDSVFHQLQVMFAHLRLGRASCYYPRAFWQSYKDYDGQPIDVREHQDAYEFFTRLQDSVDSYLRATGQTPAMQAVMGGKFAAQIICKDVNYRSEREEEFYQISVDVKGFHSLEKSLEGYVAGELMEGDNSYYCEELGARVAAVRRTVIKELPATLVVHLKRFEYDHLNMTRYKLRDRFEFPVVLDMFKYTADGLAALEATGAAATGGGAGAGMDPAPGSGAGAAGGSGAEGAARPRNSYLYELKGIVVHSGTAFAGHYYSFIKERPRLGEDGQVTDGSWYRFDDKVVTPWSIQDLEADCFGGRPASSAGGGAGGRADAERPYSAYMLFYERRDSASYDRPAADLRAVPRDLVIAAAATPVATPMPTPPPGADSVGPREAGRDTAEGQAGGGEPDDMDTDGPQQQRPHAGPPRPADPPVIMTPYGMPVLMYQNVLRENLQLMHKLHVLNKDYFAFVRQVVEVTWETVHAGRKTRRRDLNHHHSYNNTGGSNGAMAPPPSPGAATATATTASGSGGAESVSHSHSSAPSQRNEELDETLLLSARLASAFLLNVYLPAPAALRTDLPAWRDMLRHLLQASPRACVELLRTVAGSPSLLNAYFVRSVQDGIWLADVLAFALQAAGRATAAPATAAGGSPGGGGDEPPQPQQQQQALLAQQLQAATAGLTGVLCDLAFAPLHDQQRSEPQYAPVCRCLAALVGADVMSAYQLLNAHLADVFALPGFLLAEGGAGADPDMAPELSAALLLLHDTLQYCYHVVPAAAAAPGGGGAGAGGGTTTVRMQPVLPAAARNGDGNANNGTAAAGSNSARQQLLMDLSDQLEGLAGLHESGLFEAMLAHSGLLGQPHVTSLLHFLLAGSATNSLRFLNALLGRLAEVETAAAKAPAAGAALLDILEALPAALDVTDNLRVNRFYALLFGSGSALRGSLTRLLAQAQARQTGLSWMGMAVGQAVACVWTGSEAARTALRSVQGQALMGLMSPILTLTRQLTDFAQAHAQQQQQQQGGGGGGGQSQGGAAAAAARESAALAALAGRARRISTTLSSMVQQFLPAIQAAQARAQERGQGPAPAQQAQVRSQHPRQQQQQQQARVAAAAARSMDGEEGAEQDGDNEDGAGGPVRVEDAGVEEGEEVGRVYEAETPAERHRQQVQVAVRVQATVGPPQQPQPQGVAYADESEGEGEAGSEGEGEGEAVAQGVGQDAEAADVGAQAEEDEGEELVSGSEEGGGPEGAEGP